MYKNGLHFPIFYIFINDNVIIKDLNDIICRKTNFIVASEEMTNNAIIESINQNKGCEIYSYLLNNFDYLTQTDLKLIKENITSKFVKKTEFILLINTFKIDFLKIKSLLIKLDEIGIIDYSVFYSELYSLLYKSFAIKLGGVINYSDFENSELFFDFDKSYKLFLKYSAELKKFRPNIIRNYDFKKNYVTSFLKSFESSGVDELNKIEVVKIHTDREIKKTFGILIKKTMIVNVGVNPKTRNKVFKPIFKEINSAISGKVYDKNSQNNLTKEVKRFFSDM